ncbi:MAG: hypothetical protein H7Z37_18840 [Pyrinomonadaceae bacterium]|nr:hypothetical protein [Pyrinomonadaceae bacterium]
MSFPRLLQHSPLSYTPFVFAAFVMLFFVSCVFAQNNPPNSIIIESKTETDVISLGKSIVVRGDVKEGVVALGGDVIIEGRVEGDVATIGGSVIQRENSFIGGDVIVIGGAYHHGKTAPNRNPDTKTIMYAGYEDELRNAMQNPSSLIAPEFSVIYLTQRILAMLFWFITALIVTTFAPKAVGRAIVRLQTKSLRIAIIGCLSGLAAGFGIFAGLRFLPTPLSVLVGFVTVILLILAYTFGHVTMQALTGKFLQKRFLQNRRSESLTLLVGTIVWTLILSIPFVWMLVSFGLLMISLGIILTARPIFSWK